MSRPLSTVKLKDGRLDLLGHALSIGAGVVAVLLQDVAKSLVLLSRSLSLSGMKTQEVTAPTMAKAAPIKNTPPRWPLNSSEKLSWMGVQTCVPMAAPALPTRPRS